MHDGMQYDPIQGQSQGDLAYVRECPARCRDSVLVFFLPAYIPAFT